MNAAKRRRRALTVALNPAVDIAYLIDGFHVGEIHTARAVTRVAGGKANNVARVLNRLGVAVTATGFAGGHGGAFLQEELQRQGIEPCFEPIAGETRTCLALVDRQGGTVTEVREPGPAISPEEAGRFLQRFERLAAEAGAVVISGSQPPGLPADFSARVVALARRAGAYVVLDGSGAAFREGLKAGPDLVKPNREELAGWWGRRVEDLAAVAEAAQAMRAAGAGAVAVSLGPDGLLYIGPEGAWLLRPPAITAVNPVGSGDSLVAGIVAGRQQGREMPEALRLGVACGTANAMTEAVASPNLEDVAALAPRVLVEPLSPLPHV